MASLRELAGDQTQVEQEPTGNSLASLAAEPEDIRPPLAGHIERMVLGEPIEDWLPTDQAELAGDIFNSLDKPQDERGRMSSAILLADMFDADINTMRTMQPAMMKQIYGDELERISKRFAANPMEGGFFEKSIESLRRGDAAAVNDQAIYSAVFEGVGSKVVALADRKRLQSFEEVRPIEGNKVSELFYASTRIVPAMARGYWDAIPTAFEGMLIGAGAGLVLGQLGPQVLTLADEPGLISKGAMTGTKIGFSVGSMVYWYKQGAGSMYANMIDKGHDPEIAKQVAGIAAIPYAIVEHSQVSKLIPGGRKNSEAIAAKVMIDVFKAAAIKYGKTWTEEVFEEVVQEMIAITAERISGSLSDVAQQESVKEFILENSQRLWETTKGAAKAMALLPGPNVVIDIRSGHRSIVSQKRRDKINKKVDMFRQGVKIDLAKQDVVGKQADKILDLMVKGDTEAAQVQVDKINNDAMRRAFTSSVSKQAPTVTLPTTPEAVTPPKAVEAKPEAVEGKRKLFHGGPIEKGKLPTVEKADLTDIRGVFFTEDAEVAKDFGTREGREGVVQEFEVEIKNPATGQIAQQIEDDLRAEGVKEPQLFQAVTDELLDRGFDSVIRESGFGDEIIVLKDDIISQPTPTAKPAEAAKIPTKALAVKPVLPTKIVSPGQAGPFKVTFKATEGLPETRVIVDPQVRRAVQSGENKLAVLRTRLKQAQADKKQAVIAATQNQITKAEAQIAKLKERQQIKLTTTIEKAKTKVLKLQQAVKFKDSLRRDAISMIRAIPKELQKDFILRASNVTTIKGIQRLGNEIQAGLDRAEKREAVSNLRKAAKAINPKTMLPEFAGTAKAILDSLQLGKPQEETILKNSELKAMAQQVLDTAREDSIAAFQAQKMLKELREKTAKTFSINKLSLDAIEQITDTLTALRFQSESDTIAAKDENAEEAIRRRVEIKRSIVEKPELPESLGGKSVKKFKLLHDNLESALDAVAGARPGTYDLWIANKRATTQYIYDVLNGGVDDQIRHNEKARNIFRQILTDNGVSSSDILNWSARPEDISLVRKATGTAPTPIMHTFTLSDANKNKTKFDFTVNELMSIFMHARNSHNLSVLLNDGLDRRIDGKKQKVRGFTVEIIDDMIDSLTPQQKKIARQVGSKLMDGFNKDGINETSVKLEFFELAKVDNYWPARRSIIRTPKGKKIAGAIKTTESMGLLKERVGVGNPMALSGFFETVYTTNKNVSSYVGLAEPLREVKSVYNTDTIEKMENVGRGDEAKVITDLIIRFEDQSALVGPLDTILKKMLGGFAKSKLFLNLKIAPRQQISSFLISAYVDGKYLAEFKGVANKDIISEIGELSPQMKARFEGLQFDRDVGDSFLEHEMMNYLTGETSLIDKTALGMKFFDTNAIVDIYRATKAEVIDKGVDITTTDGKAALKDRFEWVIRHTQPMWHPKDRSLLGSDPRPLVRSLTMFMSQREQLVRMVNNGISDYANSEKTTEDTVRLGRTLGTVALNLVAFTLYNLAWATLIQKRERDVKDLGKAFVKDIMSLPFFGKYIAKSFDTVFNILTDKPVFSQSFDEGPVEGILREILLEAIPNYTRAGIHFVSKEKYKSGPNKGQEKWENELFVATDALVSAIASLKGVPYYGAKDIIKSVNAQLTDNEKKSKAAGEIF